MPTNVIASPARTAARTLGELCVGLRWGTLDDDVRARTRELLLDLIGVALAGSRAPSSPPAADVALRLGGQGRASIVGADRRTAAVWAALANGTAAHAVELDDVTTESSLHPGVA
ncbi:MAG: MmgE/PrpD family protein, partial [Chloroflexi bacterium]|nr:MmgE/PrpD family protein [Chloroflexota bacterium]